MNHMTDTIIGDEPWNEDNDECQCYIEQGLCDNDCENCPLINPYVDDLTDEE